MRQVTAATYVSGVWGRMTSLSKAEQWPTAGSIEVHTHESSDHRESLLIMARLQYRNSAFR